ncbi:transcription antitermination factor NusB [Jeotgalibacillus campisalis]|uniref:Transcription antitermination protein NusB n=1 Tax=Jeotgalibacillus campisalis TaxID=220754 RepID=A0A0C2R6S6_9BACL|nr:transcription antitermination factor NusB [Jeotgalibacillus campisalis]KIL45945.1 transcription antitermination protein NusB [Jeotgalibacillus campisalis]
MKRRTAREKALQALFQMDMNEMEPLEAIDNVLEDEGQDEYLESLVVGVNEHKEEIDKMIQEHLQHWKMERLARVDRNILRIALYELLYKKEDVPHNVVLNEAVEISKRFGDDKSSKFVNGVLSKLLGTLHSRD